MPGDYLTDLQEKQMSFQPDMIAQFARFVARQYDHLVEVRADVYVSLNGRASRPLVDPGVDLARVPAGSALKS